MKRVFWHGLLFLTLAASITWTPTSARADEGGVRPFEVEVVEDFSFLGCPDSVDPDAVDTCGTAKGHPFGPADVGTIITGFRRLPTGCFRDTHTTTLDFGPKGSLVVDIDGTLCPAGGRNFNLSGRFTVSGGTGIFIDANGQGSVTAFRDNGLIHSTLDGVIALRQ